MLDRKTQILDIAADLLQTKSVSAFSYQDISDRLGIRKASVHHHFRTKRQLVVALAERYVEDVDRRFSQIEATTDDPWRRLDAWVAAAGEIAASGDRICPMGSLSSQYNVLPDECHQVMHRLHGRAHAFVTGIVTDGRAQGVMHFAGEPADRATMMIAAMQGALQLQRSEPSDDVFARVTAQLRSCLESKS